MRDFGTFLPLMLGFALAAAIYVSLRVIRKVQARRAGSDPDAVPAADQIHREAHPVYTDDLTRILGPNTLYEPDEDRKFQTLADMSPAGIFLTDSDGDCIYVNRTWLKLSGLKLEQALGPRWVDAIHPEDRDQVWTEWDQAVREERLFKMDFRMQQPSGKVVWVTVLSSPFRNEDGEIAGFVGVNIDISEQKALQLQLDFANRQFRQSELIANIGSWRLLLAEWKMEWSDQVFRIHQLPIGEMPSMDDVLKYYPGEAGRTVSDSLKSAVVECSSFDIETDFVTETGVLKKVRNLGEPEFEDGMLVALVGVIQDVTDQSSLRDKLRNIARIDELTGIANRKMHNEMLESLLGQDSCPVDPVALFIIDLDNFKTINDNLGHPAGDELLREVAHRLSDIPDVNLVSRIGGDEFAIIKQQRLKDPDFMQTAQQLEACFHDDFQIDGQMIDANASFGAAISNDSALCPESLAKSADIALYVAKASGRKDCRFYDENLGEEYHKSGQLRLDLKTALKNDQLELRYQPIVSLSRQKVVAFEALLRWEHPTLGQISPDEFIPLMEQADLINPIGKWVILEACRQASKWPDDVRISVNISAIQLKEKGFSSQILQALAAYQLKPGRLELEITETVLIDDVQEARKTLTNLQNMGVRIALDDFGTGYSSLSYLRSFAFNNVKIDQSFIREAGSSEGTGSIIAAVMNLGEALQFDTVAEGVENAEQLAFLQSQGCDQVQGYFLSKPVAPGEIYRVIAELTGDLAKVRAA